MLNVLADNVQTGKEIIDDGMFIAKEIDTQ